LLLVIWRVVISRVVSPGRVVAGAVALALRDVRLVLIADETTVVRDISHIFNSTLIKKLDIISITK
jgi:hypothetical protein